MVRRGNVERRDSGVLLAAYRRRSPLALLGIVATAATLLAVGGNLHPSVLDGVSVHGPVPIAVAALPALLLGLAGARLQPAPATWSPSIERRRDRSSGR